MSEPFSPPAGPPDWSEVRVDGADIDAARAHLRNAQPDAWSAAAQARVRARLQSPPRRRLLARALPALVLIGTASLASAMAYRGLRARPAPAARASAPSSTPLATTSPPAAEPVSWAPILRAALSHLDAGRWEAALALAEANPGGPFEPELRLVRVRALIEMKRRPEALSLLRSSPLRDSPRRLELITLRAELAEGLGDCQAARLDRELVLREGIDPALLTRARAVCPRVDP